MILIDTSVWIDVFRVRQPLVLTDLVQIEEVVTCLPVLQEVLQGFRDARAHRIAEEPLRAIPMLESPLTEGVFLEAVSLYRTARVAGFTIRSGVDCLIAVCALRHDIEILHRDRDFASLARVSQLRQRAV